MQYYLPIIFVVFANTLYHVAAKGIPTQINTFFALTVTYIIAAVFSLVLFFFTGGNKDIIFNMKALNYAPILLGVVIVGLEFGFIWIYKVGWNISIGSLVCNVVLAVALIGVGLLFYKEQIGLNQIIGILFCLVGLVFINK